jgi:hypothetical protein
MRAAGDREPFCVVEANRHQCHDLDDLQAALEAPAKELGVAHGKEKAGTTKLGCIPDQRFHVLVRLPDCVREERDSGRVAADPSIVLDHLCLTLAYGVADFAAPVVAVDEKTHSIARAEIILGRGANRIAGYRGTDRCTLKRRDRLPYVEAELRVQAQRPRVVGRLQQTDAGKGSLSCPLEHGNHQPSPDTRILYRRIDRDRPDPSYARALIEKIAPHNLPVALGDDRVEARVREQPGQNLDRDIR